MGEPHGGVSSVDPGKERSPGVMSFSCERAVKILPLGKLKINFYFYSTYAYLCLMILRQANLCDIESILAITDAARDFQRSSGFVQWEDGYPDCSIIETDIAKGTGYVLVDDKLPICYVVLAEEIPAMIHGRQYGILMSRMEPFIEWRSRRKYGDNT